MRNIEEIVTIDFDNIMERIDNALICLIDFLPCKMRISGGRKGLHFKKYCTNEEEYKCALLVRERYDDLKRLFADSINEKAGLQTNILLGNYYFDGEFKKAGEWVMVENKSEAEAKLNKLIDVINNGK